MKVYYSSGVSSLATQESSPAAGARNWSNGRASPLAEPGALVHAQQLLRENYTTETVADKCGYASVSGFSQAFKRQTGTTPAAWYIANVRDTR